MHSVSFVAAAMSAFCALAAMSSPARAADSYDGCTGFIDSAPATIATQGVWCLRRDLSTAIGSGAAISIAANNVTIDCNGFKIGGLPAGGASQTYGVSTSGRLNSVVRNCAIRGFYYGVSLTGGAGHLVEDNRMDHNLRAGIYVTGDSNLVRRNRIHDTGGGTGLTHAFGIVAFADVVDNTVSGVFASTGATQPHGISMLGPATEARGNRISWLTVDGGGEAFGIAVDADAVRLSSNHVALSPSGPGTGILGYGVDSTLCLHNSVVGFDVGITNCGLGDAPPPP